MLIAKIFKKLKSKLCHASCNSEKDDNPYTFDPDDPESFPRCKQCGFYADNKINRIIAMLGPWARKDGLPDGRIFAYCLCERNNK